MNESLPPQREETKELTALKAAIDRCNRRQGTPGQVVNAYIDYCLSDGFMGNHEEKLRSLGLMDAGTLMHPIINALIRRVGVESVRTQIEEIKLAVGANALETAGEPQQS